MRTVVLGVGLALAACRSAGSTSTSDGNTPSPSGTTAATTAVDPIPVEPMGDAARGKDAVARFQCARCHGGLVTEPVKSTSHCVQCHVNVMAGGFDAKAKAPEWKKHVAHLTAIPSLSGAARHLRYDWLVRYVSEPHDLRPALSQNMPRLAISRDDARDVAAYLAVAAPASPPPSDSLEGADATRGRSLMDAFQCGSCHRMSGVAALAAGTPLGPEAPPTYQRSSDEHRPAVMLAPDLRFTRERMHPSALVEWLLDPAAMKPDTLMPKPGLTLAQARDVAAYILQTPLARSAPRPVPETLPTLSRRVGYDEVAHEVFDVTCRHCHGNPDDAIGDGGPGNTGGFGFKRRGINLTSYEEIQGGYLDDAGKRRSLFEPMADGTPRMVAALLARHREEAGAPNPDVRGMPLGFAPLSAEQLQLVSSWVAQGRPR